MSSSNPLRDYKHDITGKFKDVTAAISALDADPLKDKGNLEIFHAIHEVLLRMVKTSRSTLLVNFTEQLELVISDKTPQTELTLVHVEGAKIRYRFANNIITYFYFLTENSGDVLSEIGKVSAVLPISRVLQDFEEESCTTSLEEIVSSLGL